jgi:hypothetical protein
VTRTPMPAGAEPPPPRHGCRGGVRRGRHGRFHTLLPLTGDGRQGCRAVPGTSVLSSRLLSADELGHGVGNEIVPRPVHETRSCRHPEARSVRTLSLSPRSGPWWWPSQTARTWTGVSAWMLVRPSTRSSGSSGDHRRPGRACSPSARADCRVLAPPLAGNGTSPKSTSARRCARPRSCRSRSKAPRPAGSTPRCCSSGPGAVIVITPAPSRSRRLRCTSESASPRHEDMARRMLFTVEGLGGAHALAGERRRVRVQADRGPKGIVVDGRRGGWFGSGWPSPRHSRERLSRPSR